MDDTVNHRRPRELRRVRRPLIDTTQQVNITRPQQQGEGNEHHSSCRTVPQESLQHQRTVNEPNSQVHLTSSPANARLSAVLQESQQESNRNSQISQASTNVSGKSRRKVHIGPWVLGKTLGRGASARVRKAKHALTGQIAAVKIVSKAAAARADSDTGSLGGRRLADGAEAEENRQLPFGIEREVVIMKLIEHHHIVRLFDVWENRGELYMVMEYVDGGNMLEFIDAVGPLDEVEAVRYFRQMISALGYCHAFGICHRDLKLENLLVDRELNLKIADFGFAALQPSNHMLQTCCGSPHYAAPEIIEGKRYHGDAADIWSCGIILFGFLNADLPFLGDEIKDVLDKVRKGRYRMPKNLSKEAKDLLRRMLQLDPGRRINMQEIWQHPLIRKYDIVRHDDGTLEQYAGPSPMPSIRFIRPRNPTEIDREIFRNLHTLWHSEKPEVLAQRLLNDEENQEKFFYCLLLKYREDRREDFQGLDFEYSASDYHHQKTSVRGSISRRQRLSQSSKYSHRSRYSIPTSDRERSGSSRQYGYSQTPRRPGTSDSYDPFRPSSSHRYGPSPVSFDHTGSRSQSKRSTNTPGSLRHPAVMRLTETDGPYTPSSASSNTRSPQDPGYGSSRRSGSRRSVASTGYRSSPPIIIRPSSSHKRGVSFDRARRPSISSPLVHQRDGATSRIEARVDIPHSHSGNSPRSASEQPGSPVMDESPYVRSRKPVMTSTGPLPPIREARAQSHLFKEEARQVSSELGRFCEEVFNRSSVSLADRDASAQPPNGHVAQFPSNRAQAVSRPPGAVWSRNPNQGGLESSWQERPLPPTPAREQDSFAEEIRATRDRLQQRSAEGAAGASQGYLDEVIAHLDKLMQPSTTVQGHHNDEHRRVASATADCRSPIMTARLPAIREEYRLSGGGDGYSNDPLASRPGYRVASAPVSHWASQSVRESRADASDSIRLVEQEELLPVAPVAPLNVRKKSERSSYGESDTRPASVSQGVDIEMTSIRYTPEEYRDLYQSAFRSGPDESVAEDSSNKREKKPGKKLGWFKRGGGGAKEKESRREEFEEVEHVSVPDETTWFTNTNKRKQVRERPDEQAAREESRKQKLSGTGGKKGFFTMFSKRDSTKGNSNIPEMRVGTPDTDDKMSITTSVTSARHKRKKVQSQPQRHWLARILGIKPASKIFCFTMSKVRARREIASILREWRRYGLRDIIVDKHQNMIFGRVDVQNFLHIKPVTFTCNLHTVLEKGRSRTASPLSIARFRQEKGAASSFMKVVNTLENVLTQREVLVMDKNKCRAMEKVLGEYLKG